MLAIGRLVCHCLGARELFSTPDGGTICLLSMASGMDLGNIQTHNSYVLQSERGQKFVAD